MFTRTQLRGSDAEEGRNEPVSLGLIPNNNGALLKLLKKIQIPGRELLFCYESGPCGYEIYRYLTERGVTCVVAATPHIRIRAGDKVKTDRRDARKLAKLFRSGELTPVWVSDERQEALMDLVRSREDAVRDLQRKRCSDSILILT